MATRQRRSLTALAVVAVVAVAAALAGIFSPEPRDVATSAPSAHQSATTAPSGVLAAYEAESARERERLATLSSHALREEIGRLHRGVSDMSEDRRRHIDEEGSFDAGDVAMYDSALRDLRSDLDTAYYELEKRGELSPADEVVRQRDVDVAEDKEDVEASRADRDRYAREGHSSADPDHADELAIREADVSMAEAALQASEARLRIAKRASAVPERTR